MLPEPLLRSVRRVLPEPLLRSIRRVVLRIRAQRAIEAATTTGLAGLGVAAVALVLAKTGLLADAEARVALAVAAALPALGALAGALRPVPLLAAARSLDRAHGSDGRIAAALELAREAEAPARADWVAATIADAQRHTGDATAIGGSVRRAAPLRAPRDLAPLTALAIACAFLGALEIPSPVVIPPPGGITPLVLHHDDVDAYESRLRALLEVRDVAPEVREEAEALNRVLEDLADRRIDREESLRALAEIEARIDARRPADASLLRDELRAMGTELRRSEIAAELAEAMRDADAARAAEEMHELAERIRTDPPSPREVERLQRAIEEAARDREEGGEDEELERREEEMQRLLRQRDESESAEAREQQERLLDQRRRELERLRREHQERQEARRELDRLRRDLEDAARELAEEQGAEQEQEQEQEQEEPLERAAQDLDRMAEQQMTEQQMQDLARQLRELRELIRRQRQQQADGQGGEGREQRRQGGGGGESGASSPMDRFVLRARGAEDEGRGEGIPIGARGGGQQGEGQTPGSGAEQGGQGGQGAGTDGTGGPSEGGDGQDPGQQQMLMLGEGGEAQLEIPGLGGGQEQQGGAGGRGEPQASGGAGDEHAPASHDDPTGMQGEGRTVQLRGDAQRGPTRSEVIRSAAQRGFATRDYRGVYAEYADHAEEVIERDRVPPGYRFYVRRYFQLIRPRDGE